MFLNGAAEKLKREQDARKAELRRKQALERRAAATAEARRRERDDAEKRERLEQRQRDAEARVARERVLANNEGVAWDAALVGVRSDAAVLKGIRARADDKIVLPPSAWRALERAGALADGSASRGGHVFFEVSTPAGARTHAGVLGFDGEEGNAGLPLPVLRQLGLVPPEGEARAVGRRDAPEDAPEDGSRSLAANDHENDHQNATDANDASGPPPHRPFVPGVGVAPLAADVRVSYRRLPKGTYAKLQPRSQDFQGELAAEASVDLRGLLERAMTRRCTLTVGDEIVVRREEGEEGSEPGVSKPKTYSLRVVEVQPDDALGAVSLMETDVEVDIAPSVDYEEAMRALAEAERRRLEAAARSAEAAADATRADEAARAEAEARAIEAREAIEAAEARSARFREAHLRSLPPEPGVDDSAATRPCRFALPGGGRAERRFFPTDPVAAAFSFVRAQSAGAKEGERFRLVTRYPRRVVEEEGGGTVGAAGMGEEAGETWFVEKIVDEETRR
jgi:ubiquitin fusion degradation protein 1